MAFNTVAWALKLSHLDPITQLFLVKLASYRNQKTGQCNPSQKTLALACKRSVSTANKHLLLLEKQGLIRRTRRYDAQSNAVLSTQYEFPLAHPSAVCSYPGPTSSVLIPFPLIGDPLSGPCDTPSPADRKQTSKRTRK